MKHHIIITGFLLWINGIIIAQVKPFAPDQVIQIRPGEKWFGGAVNEGHHMPFQQGYRLDLYGDNKGNQAAPLLLSTKGRFVWSEEPFQFVVQNNQLVIRLSSLS